MAKYQYGRGLSSILVDGMLLSLIMAEIKDLQTPIDKSLLLHNLYETFSSKKEKQNKVRITQNLKELKSALSPRIASINEHIAVANSMLKGLDFSHQIPRLQTSDILQAVSKRLKTIFEVDDAQKLSNDHFRTLLSHILQRPTQSINDFIKLIQQERYGDELEKLSESYQNGIKQSLDVCSVGYYSTAVFIAGRTVEELVNSYFSKIFKLKKKKRFDLSKETFAKKINLLNTWGYLGDALYHSLSNIRIDRNKFGHPSAKILSKRQAHLKILTMIELIPAVEKKIKKLT